jgi:hypothetical protein
MAVAAADLSKRGASSPEDLADARGRLTKMAGQGADVASLIERGRADLETLRSVVVEKPKGASGSANFIMKIVGDKIVDARQLSGDSSFGPFSDTLRKSGVLVHIPKESGIEILRRGILSCKADANECRFVLLGTEDAVDIATQEADAAKTKM